MLEGRICRWLFLFQEFFFEVIVKQEKLNVGSNHLSQLKSGESGRVVDDQLPDTNLFKIEAIPDSLSDIAFFLTIDTVLDRYSTTHKRHLVVCSAYYQLIAEQLYKLGLDNIFRRYILDHEPSKIFWECHSRVAGGHVGGKSSADKILQVELWWPTLFKYANDYARACDVCKRVDKPSHKDELPLHHVWALQAFEKWEIDFIGPIISYPRDN
jgi:hypothetical protein